MPTRDRGGSATGFRVQLLACLGNQARTSRVTAQRLQQRVAFERFLARLGPSGDWVFKGGFALELRYGWGSRPTKDIDLRVGTGLDAALAQLRTTIAESAGTDHFRFEIAEVGQELHQGVIVPWSVQFLTLTARDQERTTYDPGVRGPRQAGSAAQQTPGDLSRPTLLR